MRELNAFQQGTQAGAPLTIGKQSYPKGRRISRHRMEVVIPLANNNSAGQSVTGAIVLTILETLFGTFSSYFQSRGGHQAHPRTTAIPFDVLREMCIAMTGRDVLVSVGGVMTPLQTCISAEHHLPVHRGQRQRHSDR